MAEKNRPQKADWLIMSIKSGSVKLAPITALALRRATSAPACGKTAGTGAVFQVINQQQGYRMASIRTADKNVRVKCPVLINQSMICQSPSVNDYLSAQCNVFNRKHEPLRTLHHPKPIQIPVL